ncbi:MAG: polysaccharide pyruvyl transferase family protein [Clostridia bacterium]|nr:polysaccharide pyruvyl transferase family protein [Clostridia bacterium]
MKIYLKAYVKKNLGDDLFIKIITDRYKDNDFFLDANAEYLDIKNLKCYSQNKAKKYIGRGIKYICRGAKSLDNFYIFNKDLYVLIGGSMFIENKYSSMMKKPERIKKDYYIIGTNFGPYESDWYLDKYKKFFLNAKDVCFRDKKSYNMFKDIASVRTASDVIFSLDTSNINMQESRKVIISVIDCSKKNIKEHQEDYEHKICEIIDFFRKRKYNIQLMSFCKAEGDELAIERILSKYEDRQYIETYYYNGNIKEALEVLGKSSIIVGTRFHANVLGMIMDKVIIPIAYSDKTINMLEDIEYKGKIIDIRSINKFNINSITEEDLKYKVDIKIQIEDANKQFEILDRKILNKE